MRSTRAFRVAGIGAVTGLTLAAGAQSADAAAITAYQMLEKRTVSTNYVNKSDVLGSCTVLRSGTTCNITRVTSATRTVSLSLGASRGWASGQLGISSASTVSTSVACTSPPLSYGQTFRAWPVGTRYSYKVRKLEYNKDGYLLKSTTSGTLYAFNPRANAIACG